MLQEIADMNINTSFHRFMRIREGIENVGPHEIAANPPMKIPSGIQRIVDAFKKSKEVPIGKEVDSKAGGEKDVTLKSKKIFVVGGAVRDYLLGHTPRNYDLCTDAHPDEVERILMNARPPIQVVKKNANDGTVKVSVDGETWEIETMRKPTGPVKDKDQGISYTVNPAEDSERRDFTCNSLYYDIASHKIIDHCGGIRHLQDGIVKSIGNPGERASQDGMHKYRYARMVNKIPNAKTDDETLKAFSKSNSEDLDPEEIRAEFWRGMEDLHTSPDKFLQTYQNMGLLKTVFPKLTLSMDFPKCNTCKSRPIILASLLKNNKPAKLVDRLKELHYTDREIKDAVFLINLLVFSPEYIYDYKKELLNSGLSKRQIMDWAKINRLNSDLINKLINYKFQVNPQEVMDNEGLQGDNLRERIRHLEAQAFMNE